MTAVLASERLAFFPGILMCDSVFMNVHHKRGCSFVQILYFKHKASSSSDQFRFFNAQNHIFSYIFQKYFGNQLLQWEYKDWKLL